MIWSVQIWARDVGGFGVAILNETTSLWAMVVASSSRAVEEGDDEDEVVVVGVLSFERF